MRDGAVATVAPKRLFAIGELASILDESIRVRYRVHAHLGFERRRPDRLRRAFLSRVVDQAGIGGGCFTCIVGSTRVDRVKRLAGGFKRGRLMRQHLAASAANRDDGLGRAREPLDRPIERSWMGGGHNRLYAQL